MDQENLGCRPLMFRLALFCSLWLAPACCLTAQQLYFPLPGEGIDAQSRSTPAQAGFEPAVIAALEDVAPRWALWRYGRLIHVKGDSNQTSDVASNRKTWHALTVGAAIQQGKIPSIQQKISVWNKELTGKHAQVLQLQGGSEFER